MILHLKSVPALTSLLSLEVNRKEMGQELTPRFGF